MFPVELYCHFSSKKDPIVLFPLIPLILKVSVSRTGSFTLVHFSACEHSYASPFIQSSSLSLSKIS